MRLQFLKMVIKETIGVEISERLFLWSHNNLLLNQETLLLYFPDQNHNCLNQLLGDSQKQILKEGAQNRRLYSFNEEKPYICLFSQEIYHLRDSISDMDITRRQ